MKPHLCFCKRGKSKIRKSKSLQRPQNFELLTDVGFFLPFKTKLCFASILKALFMLFLISTWKRFNSCKLLDDYSLKLFMELMKFKNKLMRENLGIEKKDVPQSLAAKAGFYSLEKSAWNEGHFRQCSQVEKSRLQMLYHWSLKYLTTHGPVLSSAGVSALQCDHICKIPNSPGTNG